MSTERDITRVVRSWLQVDEHSSADRVLDAVLDQLDTTPQRRATRWPVRRFPLMNSFMKFGVAAAVLVVAALLGFNYFIAPNVGSQDLDDPSPTPLVSPSLAPTPTIDGRLPGSGAIAAGSYVVDAPFTVPFGFDIGPGWEMWTGSDHSDAIAIFEHSPDPPAGHGIGFLRVANLYADPCDVSAGYANPQVGPTVDDLATALAAQPGTDATDPVAVTIDGHEGTYLEYLNTGEACGTLTRWPSTAGDRLALNNERDHVWILDVDGDRLVIDVFSFSGTSQEDIDEMHEIVEGIDLSPLSGG